MAHLRMYWQIGILGIISAFAYRHRETKKNLCQGGQSQVSYVYKYQDL